MATQVDSPTLSAIDEKWLGEFSRERKEPSWLLDLRLKAFKQYSLLPWPSDRDERWKRTELNLLSFDAIRFVATQAQPAGEISHPGVRRLSLEEAILQESDRLRSAWDTAINRAQANKFLSLTLALGNGGRVTMIAKNQKINSPLMQSFAPPVSGEAQFPLHFLLAEEGAEFQIWEQLTSDSDVASIDTGLGFLSSFASLHLGANTRASFFFLQRWNDATFHLQFQDITQEKDSKMNVVAIELGGRVFRNESVIRLEGPQAENKVLGVLFGGEHQNFENWITQNHTARKTISDIQYRGALKGEARSFFSGLVSITKDAQQSDAYQSSKSLLLSRNAKADAIPNLEILADDVKCSHGAAVGTVDQDQKYYLETRGIPPEEAEKIIIQGFLEPVIAEVPSESTQDDLRRFVEAKLIRE